MDRRLFIAGNWKMNKTPTETVDLIRDLKGLIQSGQTVDIAVCPPFVALPAAARELEGSTIALGAQNMHWEESGAYTGEISAAMLKAVPVAYVILGHSERRHCFGETDADVNAKLKTALQNELKPIVCIGETLEEREKGKTEDVVARQLKGGLEGMNSDALRTVTLAYEPVWAIGTGRTATPEQAQEVHRFVRDQLRASFGDVADSVRIQYGGSVKPANASDLLHQPDIDGALVGGASLKADDFSGIIAAG